MRNVLLTLMLALAFSSAAPAQTPQPQLSEEKIALYTKYYDLKKGGAEGQKLAYEVAKEYLQKFGSDDDQYTQAVRKFVALYERATIEFNFYKAYNAKEYLKAFEYGHRLLSTEPENFIILGTMVRGGYLNAYSGNNSLNSDASSLAKKAIDLLDSGKVTKPDPFSSLDDARGFLNFALGYLVREQSPSDAAVALAKAARVGTTKDDPSTYYYLARSILFGEYEKISTEYKMYSGKPESPEQKAMLEKVYRVADRAIDAYARAVALSIKPDQQKFKAQALTELKDTYKDFHNGSEAGLDALIAGVLSKPLPD